MSPIATEQEVADVGAELNNPVTPLAERFRALFTLMGIGGPQAVETICSGFTDESELLKHELAFCLGQMQDVLAIPTLTSVLEDDSQPIIVRHEAGEAIGAIGQISSLPVLEKYLTHESEPLRQTCELAIERIKWMASKSEDSPASNFTSVDPAPAFNANKTIPELRNIILDPKQSLFDRYRAMFSLRNLATDDSIAALVAALDCEDSALLRHEVAYVLGQLADKRGIEGLSKKLKDHSDDPMVRHECAEALGAVEDDVCQKILSDHLIDEDLIVRQSCEIALDINNSETAKEFQYADTLMKIRNDA